MRDVCMQRIEERRKEQNMTLLQQWRNTAYSETANKGDLQRLWAKYFEQEQEIYSQILADPATEVKGSVKELAEKFETDTFLMTGFLDGINDSLVNANPIDDMEEDTVVNLGFEKALIPPERKQKTKSTDIKITEIGHLKTLIESFQG